MPGASAFMAFTSRSSPPRRRPRRVGTGTVPGVPPYRAFPFERTRYEAKICRAALGPIHGRRVEPLDLPLQPRPVDRTEQAKVLKAAGRPNKLGLVFTGTGGGLHPHLASPAFAHRAISRSRPSV